MRKKIGVLFFLSVFIVSGCSMYNLTCKSHTETPEPDVKIVTTGCTGGGLLQSSVTSNRAVIIHKTPEGITTGVLDSASGFASGKSLVGYTFSLLETGAQGGLMVLTAGAFKPDRYNSNINGGAITGGNQQQSNEQKQSNDQTQSQQQQQEQAQKQQQEAIAKAAAESNANASAHANSSANATVAKPAEKPKHEPRHYRPSPQYYEKKPTYHGRNDLNHTQHKKEY